MITSLDMLQHVVEHAKRWRIGEAFKQFDVSAEQTNLTLRDHDLDGFLAWVRHLDGLQIVASASYARYSGLLHAHGRLMSGHVLHVWVTSDGERMRRAELRGSVLVGQVEQYLRHNIVGLPILAPVGAE
ncbi:hypothetical protein [Amycolatopsis echigonensis]|uniref:Uncharacterized protein n=1 Tax=Amycolatopsis echigonensis TaxID=2576905 RepID=A0A8E1W9B9_9PSEU|nr:hypothetical protein [Amycolatopsis echigonensis]MBB2506007.1 hypothetical protein [Amycolatopsis echigonensis]